MPGLQPANRLLGEELKLLVHLLKKQHNVSAVRQTSKEVHRGL
jgi:hypothetical protein